MAATISLQQDLYQGTHTGTAVPWQQVTGQVLATGLISTADAENPANQCTFGIDASFDGGKTWQQAATEGWVGGINSKTGGPNLPSLGVGYSNSPPTHVRGWVDCPLVLSIGSQISFS